MDEKGVTVFLSLGEKIQELGWESARRKWIAKCETERERERGKVKWNNTKYAHQLRLSLIYTCLPFSLSLLFFISWSPVFRCLSAAIVGSSSCSVYVCYRLHKKRRESQNSFPFITFSQLMICANWITQHSLLSLSPSPPKYIRSLLASNTTFRTNERPASFLLLFTFGHHQTMANGKKERKVTGKERERNGREWDSECTLNSILLFSSYYLVIKDFSIS